MSTRFQKGQSGNPNGRPVGQRAPAVRGRNADKLTLEMGDTQVSIREGGIVTKTALIAAVKKAQYKAALGGSPLAQKHLLDSYDRADAARTAEIQASNARWEENRAALRSLFLEAKRLGRPQPEMLPHPDDIVIDPERGVQFIGPIDKDEQAKVEDSIRFRDILIVQNVLDERDCDKRCLNDPEEGPGTAMIFAFFLDRSLPARYRLSDFEILMKRRPYERMTKRELIKTLFASWKSIGRPLPRGKTSPPIKQATLAIRTFIAGVEEAFRVSGTDGAS